MELKLKEVLENVAKPKISIIMQSYLGNYPGSRKDPAVKFMRAVKSFQEQLYKNCELIIVADNCEQTKQIYQIHYQHESNIRLVYVSRQPNERNTYVKDREGMKYFRGYPRKVGVGAATGDIITYMDSDDYLMPEFTISIMLEYNIAPDAMWWINQAWYDHSSMEFKNDETFEDTLVSEKKVIPEINEKERWNASRVKPGLVVMSPWLLVHRPTDKVQWRDTWGSTSEDADFNSRLRKEYKAGSVFSRPIYVRCHFTDKWDI